IAALAGSGVPVPGAIALCEDPAVIGASFTVVEYVPGMVIRTCQDLHRLSDAHIGRCAHRLIEVLADLHALDPHAVGLAGFGRPQGYLERQVRRWYGQWRRVATRPLADLETLHARLAESRPPESGASIVHGDFRIDNTILDPGDPATVRAVVDWEMSTLGDPLADLGLHLAYADPA